MPLPTEDTLACSTDQLDHRGSLRLRRAFGAVHLPLGPGRSGPEGHRRHINEVSIRLASQSAEGRDPKECLLRQSVLMFRKTSLGVLAVLAIWIVGCSSGDAASTGDDQNVTANNS